MYNNGLPQPGRGSSVALNELVIGLLPATPYHWRLRAASDSPFLPRTPWFTIQGNGPQETDLRTNPGSSGVDAEGPGAGGNLRLESVRPRALRRDTRS